MLHLRLGFESNLAPFMIVSSPKISRACGAPFHCNLFLQEWTTNVVLWLMGKHSKFFLYLMLYISTSIWVLHTLLRTPNARRNLIFNFFLHKAGKSKTFEVKLSKKKVCEHILSFLNRCTSIIEIDHKFLLNQIKSKYTTILSRHINVSWQSVIFLFDTNLATLAE